jgi:hypothetical protein
VKFTDGLGKRLAPRVRRGYRDSSLEQEARVASFRVGILGSSEGSHLPPPPDDEHGEDWVDPGLVEHTRPTERPHPKAQWDDAEGRWVVWDRTAGAWVAAE